MYFVHSWCKKIWLIKSILNPFLYSFVARANDYSFFSNKFGCKNDWKSKKKFVVFFIHLKIVKIRNLYKYLNMWSGQWISCSSFRNRPWWWWLKKITGCYLCVSSFSLSGVSFFSFLFVDILRYIFFLVL